jgi:hypothetical protein
VPPTFDAPFEKLSLSRTAADLYTLQLCPLAAFNPPRFSVLVSASSQPHTSAMGFRSSVYCNAMGEGMGEHLLLGMMAYVAYRHAMEVAECALISLDTGSHGINADECSPSRYGCCRARKSALLTDT